MVSEQSNIVITGGSGLLGTELRKFLPNAITPTSAEFDVRDYGMMRSFLQDQNIGTLVHCAALTSPPRVDTSPIEALQVNIVGTANVVRLCSEMHARLIYISTDYVFDGRTGMYSEGDALNPVNKYAWSKLGGEACARLYDNSLIVRLSFGPEPFPYEKAFVDQWTSREPVGVAASKIANLVDSELKGIIHIGGSRKTVMEYGTAISDGKTLSPLRRSEVKFLVPRDTSLDTSRYDSEVERNR